MPVSTAGKNLMLNALGAAAGFASLHSGAPGDTGANELSGGTPAYARKAITWSAAAGGALDSSNAPVFDVGASTTVNNMGLWSAASGGTFYASGALTPEVFGSQGTYTLDDVDVVAT